jgi:hypothetical protein
LEHKSVLSQTDALLTSTHTPEHTVAHLPWERLLLLLLAALV